MVKKDIINPTDEVILKDYIFPQEGRVIKASSLEEAQEKLLNS